MTIVHSNISAWTGIFSKKERSNDFSEEENLDEIPPPTNGDSQLPEVVAQT